MVFRSIENFSIIKRCKHFVPMGQNGGCFFSQYFDFSITLITFALRLKRNGALLGSNSARNKVAQYA